jgi:hypothetical protein
MEREGERERKKKRKKEASRVTLLERTGVCSLAKPTVLISLLWASALSLLFLKLQTLLYVKILIVRLLRIADVPHLLSKEWEAPNKYI